MESKETDKRKSLNSQEKMLFSFEKSEREQVRVSATVYKGGEYIDFRVFFKTAEGNYCPTKKGITVKRSLIPFLKDAFNSIS